MLKGEADKAKDAAKRLTEDYADHGFCIDLAEAKAIGLNVAGHTGSAGGNSVEIA